MNRRSFIRTITASGVSLFLPNITQPMRWKRPYIKFLGVSDYIEVTRDTLYFNHNISDQEVSHVLNTLFAANPNKRPPVIISRDEPFSISAFSKPFKHHAIQ